MSWLFFVFFFNYISAKDTHPAVELDGVAFILRKGLRALNVGLGFWCWFWFFFFPYFQREFVLLLVRPEE